MAMPVNRPDPSSPNAVASAGFVTVRRGYDPDEVRDFLRMVAAELARLQERERFLEAELRTAQRGTVSSVALDEEVVSRLLGEEAARLLQTAREGATQIKHRAEDNAARLLREATDEAQRLREEAEVEAARKRSDAQADAEAEIELAKQQGREMVHEAREYRERVLNELARRREVARQQIEQLVHGRERLVAAFERARIAAVDVMSELQPLAEPAEFVNLAPTTGPVPLMVPNTRPVARPVEEPVAVEEPAVEEPAVDEAAVEEPAAIEEAVAVEEPGADEVYEMVATIEVVDADGSVEQYEVTQTLTADDEVTEDPYVDEPVAELDVDDRAADEPVAELELEVDEPEVELLVEEPDAEVEPVDDDREPAPVVNLFGPGGRAPRPEPARETGGARTSVDELFARLRAARADEVAQRVAAESASIEASVAAVTAELAAAASDVDEPHVGDVADIPVTVTVAATALAADEDSVFRPSPVAPPVVVMTADSPFARRDEALTPIIVGAARRLKRVLADEQNDVLHTLRRAEPVRTVEALVAATAEHAQRYGSSIEQDLLDAALAGARSMGVDPADVRRTFASGDVTRAALDVLATELIEPLRSRLARAVSDADGDNAELATLVRGIYREWKTQRIDEQLDDIVRTAFGHGALAAAPAGTPICWMVDPNGPACPDAEDNALAGTVPAGQPFPTDHPCAPAHSGCRCMIVPATS